MASYSKVGICNLAFAMIGASAIRDFDESNKRARMAEVFYEPTRDYLLTKFDWPFARKYKKLQRLAASDTDIPDGLFAFQLPNDCKTPRNIAPYGSRVKWEVYGTSLVAATETASLFYTVQEVNPTRFSDTFVHLLSLGLAVKLAPVITQDKQLVATLQDQFIRGQNEAWESDANIGNLYREYDEDPNNDTFVNPEIAITSNIPQIIT